MLTGDTHTQACKYEHIQYLTEVSTPLTFL